MLNIFNRKKNHDGGTAQAPVALGQVAAPGQVPGQIPAVQAPVQAPVQTSDQSALAEQALSLINDGVIMTDKSGVVQYINPAGVTMTDCKHYQNAVGLDYALLLKIETKEGRELPDAENPLLRAMQTGQPLDNYRCALISGASQKRIPVAITVLPEAGGHKIITFRNIAQELIQEGEQTEFISTASHEMRTPVATIDGYISLCLNPQTATIDDRARGYLDAASKASKHLGHLFQNLLDVTKLDDGRIRPQFVPVEMVSTVKQIVLDHAPKAQEAKLALSFGADNSADPAGDLRLDQVVYASVDLNFLREIMDNLLDNAVKYTPSGGSIYVNVLGDGDRVLINVTDTGIGISATDLAHVFQKFYRADNSDTREIGGTGLGLYLVKQRAEAMGGRVWAESAFGEGTTFYVSLPRITAEEYQKRMIAVQNASMVDNDPSVSQTASPAVSTIDTQQVTSPAAPTIESQQVTEKGGNI